jgi:hypothetical protein
MKERAIGWSRYAVLANVLSLSLVALAGTGIATSANADRSTITVALGMNPEQVRKRSTASIPWSFIPVGEKRAGSAFVTTPHRLIYQDQSLRLDFPDAGNHRSMPTVLTTTADSLVTVSVSALGEYVDVKAAIAESKRLLADLRAQRFDYPPEDSSKDIYPKFFLAKKNLFSDPPPPRTVSSFEEMEAAFLNSVFYLEEFLVFRLRKGEIDVALRVTNMRRRHTENQISWKGPILSIQERADREARSMDRRTLERERAYYLDVSIVRPVEFYAAH